MSKYTLNKPKVMSGLFTLWILGISTVWWGPVALSVPAEIDDFEKSIDLELLGRSAVGASSGKSRLETIHSSRGEKLPQTKPKVIELAKLVARSQKAQAIDHLYGVDLVVHKERGHNGKPSVNLVASRTTTQNPAEMQPVMPIADIEAAFQVPNLVTNTPTTPNYVEIPKASMPRTGVSVPQNIQKVESINSINTGAGSERQTASVEASEVRGEIQHFKLGDRNFETQTVYLQVLDEKSDLTRKIKYPISQAVVRIIGSSFAVRTNLQGMVTVGDVPVGSRLLVSVDDPEGRIVPTLTEIVVDEKAALEPQPIQVLTYRFLDFYSQIFHVTQRADKGSFCGRIPSQNLGADENQVSKISVNLEAEGPFYFDEVGPAPMRSNLSATGRFCFFNVDPGLAEVLFSSKQSDLTALTMPIFAGKHVEEVFNLFSGPEKSIYLAGLPSAYEQIFGDSRMQGKIHSVSMADLVAIGENQQLAPLEMGVLGLDRGRSFYKGRLYTLTQSPEFEPSLYALPEEGAQVAIPLLQRGFTETLFQELNSQDGHVSQAYDATLGAMVINYVRPNNVNDATISFKLLNASRREVGDGWYYGTSSEGITRAVYFNLEPGVYAVVAEDGNQHWLEATTVAVDRWTVSMVMMGRPIEPE